MDWKAVLSSEIAREYLAKEQEKKLLASRNKLDEIQILNSWEELQKSIKNNPTLLKVFSSWQKQFIENPENIKKNTLLAKAVLAMDLEQDSDDLDTE